MRERLTEHVRPSRQHVKLRMHDEKTFASANNLIILEYQLIKTQSMPWLKSLFQCTVKTQIYVFTYETKIIQNAIRINSALKIMRSENHIATRV